jgi:uncharacterized cupredoxin-like copper-binding protein
MFMSGRRCWHVLMLAPFIIGASACTNTTGPASPSSYAVACTTSPATGQASGIAATENDYSIALSTAAVGTGPNTFDVTNDGPSLHEFIVLRTNLPADGLPLEANSSVNTDAPHLTTVGRIQNIQPCSTKSLTVDLKAGRYVVICDLPGHYAMGMRAPLTVAGGAA